MLIKINGDMTEIPEGSTIREAIEISKAPYSKGSIVCLIKGESDVMQAKQGMVAEQAIRMAMPLLRKRPGPICSRQPILDLTWRNTRWACIISAIETTEMH